MTDDGEDEFSREERLDGSFDENSADGTGANKRRAVGAADEVTARQKNRIHLRIHAHLTSSCVAKTPIFFDEPKTL